MAVLITKNCYIEECCVEAPTSYELISLNQTTKFNVLASYLHCHYSLNFKESRGYSNVINA